MKLVRLFGILLLVTGLTGALSSCLDPPTYPNEPSIEFNKLVVDRVMLPRPQPPVDTFRVTINFRDGDGDLGLTDQEIGAFPYSRTNPDGTFNPNQQFNYYLRIFRRTPPSIQFEEINPGAEFSHFPLLNGGVDAKAAPLKGDLTFKRFFAFGSPFLAGDEVKFSVSIKDRALNESNTVESNIYVVPPR